MLGFDRKSPEVLSHWFTLVDNFQYSSQDFYKSVEDELRARQAPGLAVTRVEHHEGGALSHKRVYLRLARERFAFDLCAAPFGRAYFFSVRFIELSEGLKGLVVAVGVPVVLFMILYQLMHGIIMAAFLTVLLLTAFVFMTRFLQEVGGKDPEKTSFGEDLDGFLMRVPFVGAIYERYIRKDTFYREDTRLMYHTLVLEIVKKKVEEVTAAKGVKLLRSYERSPILGELYKTATVKPEGEAVAAS